jgi:hypothetical protein
MPVMLTDPFGLCPPVAQNRDSSDSQDTKSGGPSATDSGDLTEADPQGAAGGTCQSSPWYFTLGGGGGGWGSWGGAAGGLDGGYNGDDSGFGVGSPIGFGGGIGSQLELVQFAFTPTGVYRFSATVNNEPVWLTGVLYGNSDLLSLLAGFQAPSGNGGGGRGVSNRPTGNPCLKSYSSSTLGKVVGLVSPVTLISDAKEVWMEWTLLPAAKYATLTGLKNASSAVGNTELLSLTNPGASVTIEAPTAAGIDALESAAANPITLLAIPFATAFDAGMRNTCSQLPNFMPPKF